jgi:tetratricopeptide (TPR) repeat protein
MRKLHLFLIVSVASLLAIGSTGCSAKAKKIYHLSRANKYFDAGQYDQAEVEYINVLRNDRENADAYGCLGIIYFEDGRYQSAAPFLFRGSQLATNNLELHLKLGFIYLAMGKTKEARDEASFVLARKPQDQEAPLLLAETATTQKEIADAQQQLQKLSQSGDKMAIEVASGTLSFQEHDFKTAQADFQRAEVLDPKSGAAYLAAGALHLAQNDLKAAEADFKAAADLSPARSPRRLQYAQFEMQTGNSAAAKNILDEMVKKTPDYIPAWVGLAEITLAEKNSDACAASLNKALARDPENYDALLLQGRLDLAQGETAKAIMELERMAKVYPQASRVHYQLAMAYLVNGEPAKGVNSLNTAVSLDTNFTEAILLLAQVGIENGDSDSAVASLKQLIANQPQLTQAQLLLAYAYRAQGKADDALVIYQQLGQSFPQNPQIPLLMGSTYLQQKNNVAARKEFTRAFELAPDSLLALEQLVDLDLTEKQFATAMQRVEKAMALNPKQAELRLLEANVFMAQGNTNQAEDALSKAIELQPESQTAYLVLAQLYFDSNQNQKAMADLNTVIGKNPKNVSALMLLGMIHNDEKDYQAAADAYEKLLAINPKSGSALNNLAYIYSEYLNQLDRAYDLAQRARNLLSDDPSAADTLGWILYKKGEYPLALSLLQESANKLPDEPDAQFHLGMTYYMMDEEEPARAAFQRALQSNKEFSGRNECNQCLSVLAVDPKTSDTDARTSLEKRIAEKPNDPIALARLASIYQRDGTLDKATETYETILKSNPKNVAAMMNLAQLYASKDPQRAFDLAKAAYKLSPDDSDVSYTLGRLAYQTGNYKLAASLLQQAAKNQPDNPQALYDFAEAAYSIGQISDAQVTMLDALQARLVSPQSDEARRFLDLVSIAANPAQAVAAESRVEEILKSDSNYVPALMVLAVINEQKTNFLAAEQAYEKVLNHFPDFAPAQRKLAILYAEDSSNTERAYVLAIKARESFPDDSDLGKALGIIVFRQGDYSRAVSLLKVSTVERSADAELFYYLGAAQYRLKNRAESKASLQRALSANLSGKLTADASQMLAELK